MTNTKTYEHATKYAAAIARAREIWCLHNSNLEASVQAAYDVGLRGEDVYGFAHSYCAWFKSLPVVNVDPFAGTSWAL